MTQDLRQTLLNLQQQQQQQPPPPPTTTINDGDIDFRHPPPNVESGSGELKLPFNFNPLELPPILSDSSIVDIAKLLVSFLSFFFVIFS